MMFDDDVRLEMVLKAGAAVRAEADALRDVAKKCAEELRRQRAEMEAARLSSSTIRAQIEMRRATGKR